MVEELDTTISYCSYQIKRAGGEAPDPSALLSLADGEGGALLQVWHKQGSVEASCGVVNRVSRQLTLSSIACLQHSNAPSRKPMHPFAGHKWHYLVQDHRS